ncbi:MAG: methyltransferase domain-containing protein [Candidatus Magnetoovum sp. WYHC-5]|nr:methyltransferase domain-containing protein [Candidatus Magnetoovum sp. WYHC-5]
MLNLQDGDKVIIPGVGSGHDLKYIPKGVIVNGVDISEVMLNIAILKVKIANNEDYISLNIMDGEDLRFPDNTFDSAILGLFLTCVFDPQKAFSEVVRVVKPKGKILIYDHLVRKKKWSAHFVRSMDAVMKYNFCSFIRRVEDIIAEQPVSVSKEIRGDFFGFIKGFLVIKN